MQMMVLTVIVLYPHTRESGHSSPHVQKLNLSSPLFGTQSIGISPKLPILEVHIQEDKFYQNEFKSEGYVIV